MSRSFVGDQAAFDAWAVDFYSRDPDSVSMSADEKEFLAQADAEFDRTMLQARIQNARSKGVYSDIEDVKKAQLAFDEKVAAQDAQDKEQFGMEPRMRKNWDPLLKRFKE